MADERDRQVDDDLGLYLGPALAIPLALLICLALFGALYWRV